MINTILLYDNDDNSLGSFFTLCANKFQQLHNNIYNQMVSTIYDTYSGTKQAIEHILPTYNISNFLFVSFLHGNEDAMYINNEQVVCQQNAYFFSNAFCYTFSCYCGKNLADILLKNNACTFWGYIDEAYSIVDYEEDFAELAVSGLQHFLNGQTIEQSYITLREETNNKIDQIYKNNFFAASKLLHNINSMVIKGNKNLTVRELDIV